MKNILFLSFLDPWSMGDGKGAPSFYKTIEGYSNEWNVCLIKQRNKHNEKIEIKNVKVLSYKSPFRSMLYIKKISFLGRILNSFYGTILLFILGNRIIKESGENTVVYAYEVNAVKAAKLLSNKFGLPLVTRFQGTVLYSVENTFLNRLKKFPHFSALETAADITIMTDDGTYGDKTLKRLGNKSAEVFFWRNGVDIGKNYVRDKEQYDDLKFKLSIKENDKILLTVSRLVSWKRIDRAIWITKKLVEQGHSYIKLLIVGDGNEKENLISLVENYGLKKNVLFLGSIDQENVSLCMDLADIFLSLYDLSNVGNPLFEAMNMGKTIITLNTGATVNIIKNNINGVLFDVEKINEIPMCVLDLLKDVEYAKKLGVNAKNYAEQNLWTWAERIKNEIKMVEKLLNNIKE
jgi:glycosyltransferase involved in cell wall biosynthesis